VKDHRKRTTRLSGEKSNTLAGWPDKIAGVRSQTRRLRKEFSTTASQPTRNGPMESLPWIKTFHIVFVVAWYAGLFYLPRLFVYHAQAHDTISIERFKIMERKLYFGIMTPSAVLAIGLGLWLMSFGFRGGWLHAKLALVGLLLILHAYLGKLMLDFKHDRNRHSHVFYRWLNEIPALPILVAAVYLVIAKPF
jgi:protoporphyrinogen IX oxidase